jgi:hypothetical protein
MIGVSKTIVSLLRQLLIGFALLGFLQLLAVGQSADPNAAAVSLPKNEAFASSNDLVMPKRSYWRTCSPGSAGYRSDCPTTSPQEWKNSHLLTLYDSNGKKAFDFSVSPDDARYFLNIGSPISNPLGAMPIHYKNGNILNSEFIILRIAKESEHWYEVEINESTGETRYVLKADPLWKRITWAEMFCIESNVVVNTSTTKLYDKPEGQEIRKCNGQIPERFWFEEIKGDWLHVRSNPSDSAEAIRLPDCEGWIKWRDARKILVGSVLNGMEVPDMSRPR